MTGASAGATGPAGTVVIVGGGASGLLVATHLFASARRPIDIVVVDPGAPLGAGAAYVTDHPGHLLDAPACEMSAFSDRPRDFVEWAAGHGAPVRPDEFLERRVYRRYLADVLGSARRDAVALSGLGWVREDAIAVVRHPRVDRRRFVVGLAGGGHFEAAHVVLAIGPPPSRSPWGRVEPGLRPMLVEDPWAPGSLDAIVAAERVLLVGTGLTMVDVVMSLAGSGAGRRRLYARSRHGLLPLAHAARSPEPWIGRVERCSTARELVRAIRVAADKVEFAGGDWRSVVTVIRRQVPELWSALPVAEQERALRLALRHWEVHRHRMAPSVAGAIRRLRDDGGLDVGRGRLATIEAESRHLRAHIRQAGDEEVLEVDAVVNCTGPSNTYIGGSPLVRQLVRTGLGAPDALGLGLAVDGAGCLVGEDGASDPGIHVLGWARRGQLLESTSIPELRHQAEEIARDIVGRPA